MGREQVAEVDGVVGRKGYAVELIAEDALMGDHGLQAVVDRFDVIGFLDVVGAQALEFDSGLIDGKLQVIQVVTGYAVRIIRGRTKGGDFATELREDVPQVLAIGHRVKVSSFNSPEGASVKKRTCDRARDGCVLRFQRPRSERKSACLRAVIST